MLHPCREPSMRFRYKMLILAVVIAFLVSIPVFLLSTVESQDRKLKRFLEENHATLKEHQAYVFALQHPEVLESIPCYCGCSRQGHKSNLHCFLQKDKKLAKKEPFDTHGLFCPMCVDIALNSELLYTRGVPISVIREQIDKPFEKYPHLHPTPTPKPKPDVKVIHPD